MAVNQGSLYVLSANQLKLMRQYGQQPFLSMSEKKFLMSLFEIALARSYEAPDSDQIHSVEVSRSELSNWLKSKNIGASPTIIKKRSQSLVESGLLWKKNQKKRGSPPVDVFYLKDLSDLVDLSPATTSFKDHRPHRKELQCIRDQLVLSDAQILDNGLPVQYARSERLWNGVLGSCMRSSFRDPRKVGPFNTVYRFGSDTIQIVTSALSDSAIAHINDLRTIRAIMTLVCLTIQSRLSEKKVVTNEFFVDIVDLCSLMGLDGSGSNRDTIRKSMERLYSTNFHIKLDSHSDAGQQFIDFFNFDVGVDDLNFRFLAEMDSSLDRQHGAGSIRRPRWYRIVLHSKTFQDLLSEDAHSVFIDNKDILRLSSGLLHLFYSWCSRRCKRTGHYKAVISTKELRYQLFPGRQFRDFHSHLVEQLKSFTLEKGGNWFDGETNLVNLFGYKIKLVPDLTEGHMITCWRDKKDPVVGDNSLHNKILKSNHPSFQEPLALGFRND